ncbi:MAG: amino acid permease, partial [Mycobacterium sp.]|nr:amino acid permease [Mycobacterium sp.]MBV9722537.1 amino acid permease [Mycobacterium sp.]
INVLGWRRPGPVSAIITYLFVALIALTIVTGSVREVLSGLPVYQPLHYAGAVPVHQGNGLVMGATVLVVLRAFANGGSSLTGVEAAADTADVFREPKGLNAGRALTVMAVVLGLLLLGVAWLAHATHAAPYIHEYPSVLSQVVRAVFGRGPLGRLLYLLVMAATAAILLAGANTGVHRFSALASVVFKNQALPQPPTNRVDRGVLVSGIVLATLSIILLLLTEGFVTFLLPIYAIPVFVAFAMTGYAMTKHHSTHRERGWSHKLAISLIAGILSSIVVAIFAVTKFVEGAWFVIFVFLVLVPVLILLNRRRAVPTERMRR